MATGCGDVMQRGDVAVPFSLRLLRGAGANTTAAAAAAMRGWGMGGREVDGESWTLVRAQLDTGGGDVWLRAKLSLTRCQ